MEANKPYYPKHLIREAYKRASSYKEFKQTLKEFGLKIPEDVTKFPMGMKAWYRKLRYEMSRDYSFGSPVTQHDLRQARYYRRLEKLGHPRPEKIM